MFADQWELRVQVKEIYSIIVCHVTEEDWKYGRRECLREILLIETNRHRSLWQRWRRRWGCFWESCYNLSSQRLDSGHQILLVGLFLIIDEKSTVRQWMPSGSRISRRDDEGTGAIVSKSTSEVGAECNRFQWGFGRIVRLSEPSSGVWWRLKTVQIHHWEWGVKMPPLQITSHPLYNRLGSFWHVPRDGDVFDELLSIRMFSFLFFGTLVRQYSNTNWKSDLLAS